MIIRRAAISHSKHRNAFGLIGIEADSESKRIRVKLARQWPRIKINETLPAIAEIYSKVNWDTTYIDQLTGEHFIQSLKREHHVPVKVINTQKNLKDPDDIERIKTMDKIEMVQWMVKVKLNHQIEFPPNPTVPMQELESQMSIFTEHKTESGNIDYFAPGDEYDNLVKSLMIACFSVRNVIDSGINIEHVGGGITNNISSLDTKEFDYKQDTDIVDALTKQY